MGVREDATSYLPSQVTQPSSEAFNFDFLGTRIFYAFVGYYCCVLNILTRAYM